MVMITGTDAVRRAVVATLETRLADELTKIESGLSLQPGSLSSKPSRPGDSGLYPRFLKHHEMPELDTNQFPAILVLSDGIGSSQMSERQFDSDTPSEIFRRVHPLRLFGYVSGQTFETTSVARDRFELAVWRTLWKNREIAENAVIDKQSYASLYSDVEPVDRAKAMISGFQSRVSVVCFESLDMPIEGQADTIRVEVEHLSQVDG